MLRQPFGALLNALLTFFHYSVSTPLLQLLVKEQSFPFAIFTHGLPTIVLVCCHVSGLDDVAV
jgi:hypothetical protein